MRKYAYIMVILCSLIFIGCISKHADFVTPFKIEGQVFNKSDNSPIENVNVIFIDYGFDDKRYKDTGTIIGKSNNKGQIIIEFDFWWGRTIGFLSSKPKKYFAIHLSKDKYLTKIIRFEFDELTEKEGRYQVPLGNLLLEK